MKLYNTTHPSDPVHQYGVLIYNISHYPNLPMSHTTTQKIHKTHFSYLDSYRFYAFLTVFVAHMVVFISFPFENISFDRLFRAFTQIGDLGVAFFFVLSGFLINYLLKNELRASKSASTTGNISIKSFYVRRILRIWPLYFFSIILILTLSWLILSVSNFRFYEIFINSKEFFYHIFMSGSIFRGMFGTDNDMLAVLWSISVEEQFYLVWPLLFYMFRKNILWIIVGMLIISSASRYYFLGDYDALRYLTPTIMSYLMIGAASGIYYEKILKFISRFNRIKKAGPSILVSIILAITFIRGYVYEFNIPAMFEIFLPLIFGTLFALVIILATERKINQKQSFSSLRLKIHNTTTYLGRISYGLYVYHMIALTILLFVLDKIWFSNVTGEGGAVGTETVMSSQISIPTFLIISTICLLLTILISSMSFKYLEKPFLKFKRKFS